MKAFLLLIFTFLSLSFVQGVEAKVLPQAKSGTVTKTAGGGSLGVSASLRGDRRAVNVYFSNLQNASLVSYMLTYKHDGQEEGAMGGINIKTGSTSQEILFGTCSKGVCRYHTGITDARLEISYTNKQGKKYLKKFRIKV